MKFYKIIMEKPDEDVLNADVKEEVLIASEESLPIIQSQFPNTYVAKEWDEEDEDKQSKFSTAAYFDFDYLMD